MLTLTEYTESLWPAMRTFWLSAYGPKYSLGLNKPLFDWQFGGTAGGRKPDGDDRYHLQTAVHNDEVIGSLGYIPVETVVRGQLLRGCWLANWMVLPHLSRVGIGKMLMDKVLAEVDSVVNVGISSEGQRQFAQMGWHHLGTLSRWVRALDQSRADELLGENVVGEWPAPPISAPSLNLFSVRQVQAFNSEAEGLWDDSWGRDGAGVRRSATLLNWRYAKHPTFRYEMLEIRDEQALRGFAVYRIEQVKDPALKIGRIVELVAPSAVAEPLIAALCEHAAHRNVVMLDFFCTSRKLDSVLQSHGFQPGDTGRAVHMPYLFQPIDRRGGGIACMVHVSPVAMPRDPDDWYITKGDADQDRPN